MVLLQIVLARPGGEDQALTRRDSSATFVIRSLVAARELRLVNPPSDRLPQCGKARNKLTHKV